MPRRGLGATAVLATAEHGALLLTAACGGQAAATPTRAATPAPGAGPAPPSSPGAGVREAPTPDRSTGQGVSQARVRFTVGDAEIIVRTADNPTSRDFVSMLPLALEFRDFNAMEKVSDLPRRLTTLGSTGRAPADGDLIYFVPWGNLGFFYIAARRDVTFDDRVIPIGTVVTGYERLNALETGPVRVERTP